MNVATYVTSHPLSYSTVIYAGSTGTSYVTSTLPTTVRTGRCCHPPADAAVREHRKPDVLCFAHTSHSTGVTFD
jgi:hypothetical protein